MVRGLRVVAVVLLLFAALLAGCSSGPSAKASVLSDWSKDAHAYVIALDGPAPDLNAKVTDTTDDTSQVVAAPAFTDTADGKHRFTTDLPLKAAHTYRVDVFSGTTPIGSRTLEATEPGSQSAPTGVPGADYTFSIAMENRTGSQRMHMAGTTTLYGGQAPHMTVAGAGSMQMTAGGFAMDITIEQFTLAQAGNASASGTIVGNGTWTLSQPGVQGSGDLRQFTMELLGVEPKAGADGVAHPATHNRMHMHMTGTMAAHGTAMGMDMDMTQDTWEDAQTSDQVWQKTTGQMALTPQQGPPNTVPMDSEGAPQGPSHHNAGSDPFSMSGGLDGLFPDRPVPGDQARLAVEQGSILVRAADGGPRTVGGQSFQTVSLQSFDAQNATGSLSVDLVVTGPDAGLLLGNEVHFEVGSDKIDLSIQATAVH